jgi:hypothetical protein
MLKYAKKLIDHHLQFQLLWKDNEALLCVVDNSLTANNGVRKCAWSNGDSALLEWF